MATHPPHSKSKAIASHRLSQLRKNVESDLATRVARDRGRPTSLRRHTSLANIDVETGKTSPMAWMFC